MTILETLQANRGGLLRLKTQLYWYNGQGWDNHPGRVCLIIDAATIARLLQGPGLQAEAEAAAAVATTGAAVLLLIDGSLKWVWVDEKNCELITSEAS
jgi:hypothetical protein